MKEENYKAPIYQGEVIRMINDKKNNIMEQQYDSIEDADFFEIHLDFMDVHYQRWSGGTLLYEVNALKN